MSGVVPMNNLPCVLGWGLVLMIQTGWMGSFEDTPSSPALGLQVLVMALAFYINVGAETQSLLLT